MKFTNENGEPRDISSQELADLMAVIIGETEEFSSGFYSTRPSKEKRLKEKIEGLITSFPAEQRTDVLSELYKINNEAGWILARDIIEEGINLDKEIEAIVDPKEEIKIYSHLIKKPAEINNFKEFADPAEGKFTYYWIPRKYDIRRFVKIATEAHRMSKRNGPVKVLDVGGGSGFLGKLIADEAIEQGIDLEIVVMDPDIDIMSKATKAYSDTENLKFEVGTSSDALRKFGPKLTTAERAEFDRLEKEKLQTIEFGKQELFSIKALLVSLEGVESTFWDYDNDNEDEDGPNFSALLSGDFGSRARYILDKIGVQLNSSLDIEEIRNKLADFYNKRYEFYQQEIKKIRDQQEKIYAQKEINKSGVDVVLNSWMPLGIDLTREIRMINAPAIIYATERGGATGIDYLSENAGSLGKERSYSNGQNYKNISYWEGMATKGISYEGREYSGSVANSSEIQFHKNIEVSDEDLEVPEPPKGEQYAWEESLEEYVGEDRIKEKSFY